MVEKMNTTSSLVEVVDRILDVGIAIDKSLVFLQNQLIINFLVSYHNIYSFLGCRVVHPQLLVLL